MEIIIYKIKSTLNEIMAYSTMQKKRSVNLKHRNWIYPKRNIQEKQLKKKQSTHELRYNFKQPNIYVIDVMAVLKGRTENFLSKISKFDAK